MAKKKEDKVDGKASALRHDTVYREIALFIVESLEKDNALSERYHTIVAALMASHAMGYEEARKDFAAEKV